MPAVLTTVARVKGALRIPSGVTISDVRIAEIIEEVEGDLLQELQLDAFESTFYTETLSPNAGAALVRLGRFPPIALAGATASGGGLSGAYIDGGALLFGDGVFDGTPRSVTVSYSAGIVPVAGATPGNVTRLATLMAVKQYNIEQIAGIGTMTVESVSRRTATTDEDLVEREIQKIKARYRRPLA